MVYYKMSFVGFIFFLKIKCITSLRMDLSFLLNSLLISTLLLLTYFLAISEVIWDFAKVE